MARIYISEGTLLGMRIEISGKVNQKVFYDHKKDQIYRTDMQENINWNLVHRYLSGESTPREKREVQAWLEEDPAHQQFLEAIKKVWEVTPEYEVDVDFEEEWRQVSQRLGIELNEKRPESRYSDSYRPDSLQSRYRHASNPAKHLLRVAAVILLVATGLYFFIDAGQKSSTGSAEPAIAMKEVQTAIGERARLTFSDGSSVILNSTSTLRFPKAFEKSRREIYLHGEAFFRVTHKEDLPFIVHTGGVAVKVLGTEFNVNAYKDNEAVEVVVREGKVAVRQTQPGNSHKGVPPSLKNTGLVQEVVLNRGQRTIVETGKFPSLPEWVALAPYLGWVNGRMVFEGTPLREVIRQLRRTYKFNFEVADSTLLSKRLTASFKRETAEKVLGLITFSLEISYELQGDTVIFKSNQKKSTP